jgi:hypothetical protein
MPVNEYLCIILGCALTRGHSGGSRGHCYGMAGGHRKGHGLSKRTHEHEAWSCASRLQSPSTPALILSAYPSSRHLDVGICALACTDPYAPITTEGRGAKIQDLDFSSTWGNDRHTVAPCPRRFVVWGASDDLVTK